MLDNSGVIVLVISNHSPGYSLNCTPHSPITITNCYRYSRFWCYLFNLCGLHTKTIIIIIHLGGSE